MQVLVMPQCLDLAYRFSARRGCYLVRGRYGWRSRRSLAAALAARLAVHVALAAIAAPATPVTPAATAFAMLGIGRYAGLSLRNGCLCRVGGALFLRGPRLARSPLLLRFALTVAARFAFAARLLLPALRGTLLGLLARFAALSVAPRVAAILTATVALLALLAPLGPVSPPATAVLARFARRFAALRSGCRRWHGLDRLALEPAHDVR